MFGFGSLRGVTPQVAAEVRQRLYRLVFPVRDDQTVRTADREVDSDAGDPDAADRRLPSPTEPDTPRLRRVHLVVVAVLLVLALLAAMVLVMRRTPAPEPLPEPSPAATMTATMTATTASPGGPARARASGEATAPGSGTGPAAGATTNKPAGGRILVHVDGKIREPGVVRLPAGSRVVDAIEAAGGAKSGADLGTVNLARLLQDGEQVLVDTDRPPGHAALSGGTGTGGATPSAAPIDLNTATLPDLEQLPGIGPALGQRILDFRAERGGFTAIEELHDISGIGEKRFTELQDRVTLR